jgi:polysaccharide biosynthesis transport protein
MNKRKNDLTPDDRNIPIQLTPAAPSLPAVRDPYGQNVYGNTLPDARDEGGLDLFEYWRILNKRKWLVLGILATVLALGVVATLMMTPVYTSTVRLQIDRNVSRVVDGGSVAPAEISGVDQEFFKTQYELLQSRAMAERITSTLRLGDDADFMNRRGFSPLGAVIGLLKSLTASGDAKTAPGDAKTPEQKAADAVMDNRGVKPVAGSRLVDLTYTDMEPHRAQKIASSFADAFVAANLDKRSQANSYAKTFLEDQLKQLKLRLEEAEKVQINFAQKEQIVVVNERESIAQSNLAAANTALGNLVSDRIKNEQLWKQVEAAKGMNLPQLLTNTVVDGLRSKRSALVQEYQEKLETFKPGYPAMVQINNKIAEIDRQIITEVKAIKDSYKASYESSQNQEAEMRKRIDALREDALDLQKRSVQHNLLKREADSTRALYENLLQRYKEVDVAGGVAATNIFVVDRAELPDAPSSPKILRNILLCLVLGLGAGAGLAFMLERMDDRVSSVEMLERTCGLATLGVIPNIKGENLVGEALADPRSPISEAYRSFCTSLQFATESGLPKTLFLTSAGAAEGKSFTSLAVARHFATMGLKVLVIDADMRNPSLHKKLGVDNGVGLSNYLTGGCMVEDAFQKATNNLVFMSSGPLPLNAADLLSSPRLRSLLSVGAEIFDFIVIDGPPVVGLADAQLLSSAASATIFVVAASQTRTGQVRGALKRLQMARCAIVGAVLTKFDAQAQGYGYNYGYGGYGYGAIAEDGHQPPQLANSRERA